MKLNKKQTAAWMALGEALVDVYVRATDISLPDDVALDRVWLLKSVRELKMLVNRWGKALPGTRGHSLNAERRKARGAALLHVMPLLVAEASDGEATMTVTHPPEMELPSAVEPN